ncbi:MAG: HEAT repeat domain-containing protein [Candidatus Wallbacteria bacterium]|nr:HEAT repeat domain-containing protein [Candidatus Wallbacteria bacterium]
MDREKLALELGSPDEEARKEAVLAMTELADPTFIGELRKATADPSPAVRFFARRAVDKLARLEERPRDPVWLRALEQAAGDAISVESWRALLADPDAETRLKNVMATLGVSDPAIVPLLWERLTVEGDVRVRASLVKAVARFRKREGFDLLAPLVSDPDPRVRANAIEALDELADERLKPLLEPFLDDADNRIRGNALKAMSRFDRPRALHGAHQMAASSEIWMRATAIWLYRELGGEQARLALERMASRETGEMAEKVAHALAALAAARAALGPVPALDSDAHVVEAIREKLADPDKNARLQGAIQAAELPRARAVGLLKNALVAESHPHVIATLVKALGQAGGEPEAAVIGEFLQHPDPRVRANAIEGLAAIKSEEAYRLVEPLLSDPNQRVRGNAAWLIHGRDPAKAFATLKQMLLSSDSELQDAAIFALREIAGDQVLELFETGLASDNPEVQMKILRVLEGWSSRMPMAAKLLAAWRERGKGVPWVADKLEDLVEQLNRGEARARLAALEKLATFSSADARARVEQATRDPDPKVKKRARELVKHSGAEEARREAFFRLGLAAYQWIRAGKDRVPKGLANLAARARQASRDFESGQDVVSSLSLRRQSLVDLGREVHLLLQTGQLKAPELEPLMREIERLELRREVADMPPARQLPEPERRIWVRFALGVIAGVVLGVGTYLLFQMPPSPNLKPLKWRLPDPAAGKPDAASRAAAAATTATTQ